MVCKKLIIPLFKCRVILFYCLKKYIFNFPVRDSFIYLLLTAGYWPPPKNTTVLWTNTRKKRPKKTMHNSPLWLSHLLQGIWCNSFVRWPGGEIMLPALDWLTHFSYCVFCNIVTLDTRGRAHCTMNMTVCYNTLVCKIHVECYIIIFFIGKWELS